MLSTNASGNVSERHRAGLWLLLGVVIIVVAYLGLRYRTQRQMRFLARMNQTLEQRVEQRTAELSQAYNELKTISEPTDPGRKDVCFRSDGGWRGARDQHPVGVLQ